MTKMYDRPIGPVNCAAGPWRPVSEGAPGVQGRVMYTGKWVDGEYVATHWAEVYPPGVSDD